MMNINIICIGKLKEDYLRMACAEYEKRLSAFCRLETVELKEARVYDDESDAAAQAALADEAEREKTTRKSARYFKMICIAITPYFSKNHINLWFCRQHQSCFYADL